MHRTVATLIVSASVVTGGLVAGHGALAAPAAPAASSAGSVGAVPRVATSTAVDPAHFTEPRPNAWFPLDPGLTVVLRGTDDGERFRERVRVTSRTRVIQGVRVRVVRDVLRRLDGSLAERTRDWYAADNDGNVWYFGERTATFDERGHLESREGSWQAGVDGAVAGLIMPAEPRATDAYRQEYLRGHAEDQAWIVGFKAALRTPAHRFHRVLRTFEWSRLEPRVLSTKFYARGVGIVSERDVAGGSERFQVVAVHRS